eukprot:scaffold17199_cov45-Cyclotella_meneghiniana.AAC.1
MVSISGITPFDVVLIPLILLLPKRKIPSSGFRLVSGSPVDGSMLLPDSRPLFNRLEIERVVKLLNLQQGYHQIRLHQSPGSSPSFRRLSMLIVSLSVLVYHFWCVVWPPLFWVGKV